MPPDAAPVTAPAPQTASPGGTTPVAPAAGSPPASEGKQPVAQAPVAEKPKPDPNAAMLAQAKRLASKAHQQEENAKRIIADAAAFKTKAERYDYLEKLQKEDPIKFMEDTGMDFQEISKRWLNKTTGTGKSPVELVKEEVDRRLAEQRALDTKAAAERETKAQADRDRQTFAGTMAELQRMVKADPAKYEVAAKLSPGKVAQDAFTIMSNHYGQHKEVLGFDAALAGAEYLYKQEQLAVSFGIEVKDGTPAASLNDTWANRFKLKAAQEAEAAKAEKAAPTRGTEQRSVVETQSQQSSPTSLQPTRKRRPPVLDYRKVADSLLAEQRAKSDN